MKKIAFKKILSSSLSMGLLFSTVTVQATFTPTKERGEKNQYFISPNNVQEVCVIPKHYPAGEYKNKDLKKEQELCQYSFYTLTEQDSQERKVITALQPKLNSTNPAVNIMKVPEGMSQQQVATSFKKIKGASKVGKYKNSTSCSYTPSILGYYHVSRILGNIGNVPPSVLRTMNINTHINLAKQGVKMTKSGELINQTWSSLLSSLTTGLASAKKDLLITDDGKQSYGAFIVNPQDEEFYTEFFTSGTDRAAAFRDKNKIFALVKNSADLEKLISAKAEDFSVNIQKLFAMKDMTEFILLDYLLDQQDRFGNIAYQSRLAYVKLKNDKFKLEIADDQEEIDELKSSEKNRLGSLIIPVKVMVLKDNDCGVSKINKIKEAGLLQLISHMNPNTYKKLFQFQKSVRSNKDFFVSNLLFTDKDYIELVSNIDKAASILKTRCESGKLKLDLDIEHYFINKVVKTTSCDID